MALNRNNCQAVDMVMNLHVWGISGLAEQLSRRSLLVGVCLLATWSVMYEMIQVLLYIIHVCWLVFVGLLVV
jgi:hypothetical protein